MVYFQCKPLANLSRAGWCLAFFSKACNEKVVDGKVLFCNSSGTEQSVGLRNRAQNNIDSSIILAHQGSRAENNKVHGDMPLRENSLSDRFP